MARSDNRIIKVGDQQFPFKALVEHAKSAVKDQPGNFWAQAAIVLLKRIYDLEQEAQTLRQPDLFVPKSIEGRRGV